MRKLHVGLLAWCLVLAYMAVVCSVLWVTFSERVYFCSEEPYVLLRELSLRDGAKPDCFCCLLDNTRCIVATEYEMPGLLGTNELNFFSCILILVCATVALECTGRKLRAAASNEEEVWAVNKGSDTFEWVDLDHQYRLLRAAVAKEDEILVGNIVEIKICDAV